MPCFPNLKLVFNGLSGALFVTAAQSVFANRLLSILADRAPQIDATKVLSTGASEIVQVFNGPALPTVVEAYMIGINDVFAFSLAGACFTILIALAIPFKRLPKTETLQANQTIPAG